MNKKLEYLLMGIGVLMFASSVLFWLAVFASPLIFAYFYKIKPMIPLWTDFNTYGLLMAFGVVAFIFLIATWGYNDKAVS